MPEEVLDREKAIEWLEKHWKGTKACPICASNTWAIGEKPVEVRDFRGGGLFVGGPVYPLLIVTCQTCGNTLFFNALVARLLKTAEASTDTASPVSATAEKNA